VESAFHRVPPVAGSTGEAFGLSPMPSRMMLDCVVSL
jgi:hypothetical protein